MHNGRVLDIAHCYKPKQKLRFRILIRPRRFTNERESSAIKNRDLPGLLELFQPLMSRINAVKNFANFTIFRFSFKFNKFCDNSLNSTRYTKIRCPNDFSVRCAEIYNFMLTDQQAAACRFYKIYKIFDFSLTSRFFNKPLRNLRFFALLCNANSTY